MEEAIKIMQEFGVMGIWGIIIYKVLDIAGTIVAFLLIGYGVKKAWPSIKKFLNGEDV